MDRETRKANLKKLQLPGTATAIRPQRKTRQNTKTTNGATTTISNYFLTPEKQAACAKNVEPEENSNIPNNILEHKEADIIVISDDPPLTSKPNTKRLKRTKLDAFIFKDPRNIPDAIKNCKTSLNDDDDEDLVVPEKKIKKAPKSTSISSSQAKQRGKSSKKKKQTTIKSAFLRNEQMFAEIAAQHCAADQFDGDDVQLALAISKSEAESKGILGPEDMRKEDVVDLVDNSKDPDLIREKLKRYGFKTAEKKDYTTFAAAFLPKANGRRIKSKWANKFTALTLRNNEVQTKKLQENIQTLLNQQFHTKALTEEEQNLSKYKLQSLLLKKCHIENNETFLDNFNNHKKTNEQYFVTDLFEITELSAGHLLKDWSVIQGRDLTPTTTKSQTSRERSIKLQNIYKDLEEYFSSRKRLEWTITDETKLDQENLEVIQETTQKDTNNAVDMVNIATNLPTTDNNHVEEELEELDDMIALIEHMQDNESSITQTSTNDQIKNILPPIKSLDVMNISSCYELRANINTKAIEIIPTAEKNEDCADISDIMEDAPENNNSADEKLKNILPPTKSLDIMHVSSCTIRTEATFNSTQTRSNSPDLFADSDVEMEEEHKNVTNKDLNEMDVVKVNKSNSSLEDNVGVTSYEVYSSDEVKNTTSLKPNNQSLIRDTSLPDKILLANTMIDLTQDDLEKQDTQLNQSKVIVEPDLFADSPLQDDKDDEIVTDINSNSQLSKYIKEQKEDILKFTLSSEITDQEKWDIKDNQKDDYFKFTLSMETKNCDILENSKNDDSDDDEELVLHEIAKDQTNSTFLNFQGLKQLETSFHKETATGDKKKQLKDSLSSNDTIFRELCNKYLNDVSAKPQKSNNKTDISLRTSFTQHLSKTKTPRKMENIMDMEMIMGNYKNIRKSNSFSTKTPKKSKYSNDDMLSKSQLFNKSDNSIDLTQNEEDDGEDDIPQDEDDDCLILSDDEINYSIWQANKTGNLNATKTCGNEEDDAISIPDLCITEKEEIKNDFIKDFPENNHKEFDYMDLLSKEESSLKRSSYEPPETLSVNNLLPSTITKDRKSSKLEFDRSEFGILEEYSEPIDFTPSLCTPRKQHLAEVSFLDSPTEKTDPMKRFSNCHKSTQKFNDLLRNIDKQSPLKNDFNELDDFDEFDRLIYQSPQYKSNSLKNPQGLEQLLTAEISFKTSQYTSPAKKTPKKSKEFPSEKQELIVNSKTYTIRYTTSPKPDYTQFSESELLKQLYNFGIKPLKRKQAVKILEYIYNQTHPIVVDDELEEDDKNKYQLDDIITLEDFDQPSTSKSCLNSLSKISLQAELKLSDANVAKVVENKLNLQDACGLDMLRYSIDLKAELLDENYVLQTNVTKKTPQPLLPFHIAWYNLVCSNPKLHETILMYEPVDLQLIYLFLKGLGYRYDPKDLKTFFDRRCIIFRYDLASAAGSNGKTRDNNRHVRKNKKPKSQTNKFK